MENRNPIIRFILLLCMPPLLCWSCIGEDMSACAEYSVLVKVFDADGNDLTGSDRITSVDMYLFDQQGFVRVIPSGSQGSFLLGEEKNKELTLIAWGNLNPDSVSVPVILPGSSLEDTRLHAFQLSGINARTVSDLFYSKLHISPIQTRGLEQRSDTIVLNSVSTGMTVQTSGLQQWLGFPSDSCRIVIENAGGSLNFLGIFTGETVTYEPVVSQDVGGDLNTALFRILPTGNSQNLTLSLYNGSTKVFSVASDSEGDPIVAPAGRIVRLFIHFEYASVKVVVTVSPWDETKQDSTL